MLRTATTFVLVLLSLFAVSGCAGRVEGPVTDPDGAGDTSKPPASAARASEDGAAASPDRATAADAGASVADATATAPGTIDGCLAACRALVPYGQQTTSLILYDCGTTCGPDGECGTKNLFGASAACSSCMTTSSAPACKADFDRCNTDKTCADFAACVARCL